MTRRVRRKRTHDICNDQRGQKGQTKKLNYHRVVMDFECPPVGQIPLRLKRICENYAWAGMRSQAISCTVHHGLATHLGVRRPSPIREGNSDSESPTATATEYEIIKLPRPTHPSTRTFRGKRTLSVGQFQTVHLRVRPVAIIWLLVSRTTYYPPSLTDSLTDSRAAACSVCLVSQFLPSPSWSHSHSAAITTDRSTTVLLIPLQCRFTTRQVANTHYPASAAARCTK